MIAQNSASTPLQHPAGISFACMYYQLPDKEPEPDITPAGHERIELFTGGRGWVKIDGTWTEVTKGALLWHIKGESTTARRDPHDPYRCLTILFNGKRRNTPRLAPRLSWWMDMDEVARFANETIQWYCDDRFDKQVLIHYVYGRLLFQAHTWQQSQKHPALPERLKVALDILERDSTKNIRLSHVAKEAGCSVAYLHEIFQAHMGLSPYEILLRHRMQKSREFLVGTDNSVKEIATDCGFSSPAAFCHTFKRRIGTTPLNYRKRHSGR